MIEFGVRDQNRTSLSVALVLTIKKCVWRLRHLFMVEFLRMTDLESARG